ncbi:MAG: hypothetical protein WC676_01215 [Candidatus Omnitrophota bacterium]
MRELLFKNLVSKDRKRTELFLSEHLEKDGLAQHVEKRTVYKIKEILEFTQPADLQLFIDQRKKDAHQPQTYIIRTIDKKQATEKYICNMVGLQYAVLGDKIYVLEVSQGIKKIMTYQQNPALA